MQSAEGSNSMQMSRKRSLQIIFMVLVASSTIFLVQATINYVEFYAALRNFDLKITSADYSIENKTVEFTIHYNATNPTPYNDLKLDSLINGLYYQGENHTVIISYGGPRGGTPYEKIITDWWEFTIQEVIFNTQFNPYSNMDLQVKTSITGENARLFIDFFERKGKYQESIQWRIDSTAIVSTPAFIKTLNLEFQQFLAIPPTP